MKKLLLVVLGLLLAAPAFGADLALKAQGPLFTGYPYTGSGAYWGIHTFAEIDRTGFAGQPGSIGTMYAAGAAVGATVGYQWGNGGTFYAIEAMASYKNLGASQESAVTGSVDSRWSFTERVKLGGPMANVLNLLPNIGAAFPAMPALPSGGVGTTHPYLFAAVHQDDISATFGVDSGRAWRVKPGFGVGIMQQLGTATAGNPGVVMDVWAEYVAPGTGITLGAPDGSVSAVSTGAEARLGMAILY